MNTKAFVVGLLLVASVASAQTTAARVDDLVKPYVELDAFSGVVFAAKGDQALVQKAYGMADYEFGVPNTIDTRFAIASITKRFTSVILEHLFDERKLSPDDSLSKWVPEFPSANAITVRQLMTHRSGIQDPDKLRGIIRRNFTTAEVVEQLKSEPLASKPGEVYSYTTANYAILAHIIERVTGKPYADAVRHYVYEPAGMKDSGELTTTTVVSGLAHGYMPDPFGRGVAVCGPEDTSWKAGGGSSYSTAADLHRFVRALYDGTLLPREAAIASWSLSKMFDKQVTSLSGGFPGASANLLYFPDDDVTVVVLSNNYATVAATITESVAAMVFEKPYSVPSVNLAADPLAAPDTRIAGSYRVEGRAWTFTVSIREGRPIATWTPTRQSAMLRVSDDTWFEPLDWATLQLKIGPDGALAEGWFNYPGMPPLKVVQPRVDALPDAKAIDAFFQPYAASNNYSGSVLITHGGEAAFSKSYGFADRGRRIPNRSDTRFHVASISILFTSTAVLRLIDEGKLSFDTRVSEIVSGVPNGGKITIRELLDQNSGLPDANDDLPNYDDLLKSHQTPQSVVDAIKGLPPHAEPGGESAREEHSGQNLLALIIEKKTGLPFAQAMQKEVFEPFGMPDSGVDDDGPIGGSVAHGQQVTGTFGLKDAPVIHWSAKPGNGSAYTTVSDLSKWLAEVTRGRLLSESSRRAMFGARDSCGWELFQSKRLGEPVYASAGRAPGFSSFLEYLPRENVAIITLTNIEHDANPFIIPELAALLLGKPYQAFEYSQSPDALASRPTGDFVFGPDFFRPSGTLSLVSDANGVTLNWPGGPAAPLLPLAKDKFKDRYYWSDVTVIRGKDGKPVAIEFGRFRGVLRR